MKLVFSWVDIIVLLILFLFALRGYKRGLSGEILRTVGMLASFIFAYQFFSKAAGYLQKIMPLPNTIASMLSYVSIFFIVYVFFYFLRVFIKRLMSISFVSGLEKGGGFLAGTLKGLCFLSICFVLAGMFHREQVNDYILKKSLIPPYIMPITPYIYDSIFIPLGEKYSGKVKGFDKQAFFMQLNFASADGTVEN